MFPLFYITITSQFLWFNKTTKFDTKCIYFEAFLISRIKFTGNLLQSNGNLKPLVKIKCFHLLESKIFQ